MAPELPPEAHEWAQAIAASAPPVSDAKLARLQMIAWGMPAASPAAAADPAEAA
jgi:hypothetical protein